MGTVRGCPLLAHSLISEQQLGLSRRWEGSTALGAVREPGFLSSSALHPECTGTLFSYRPSVSFSYCSWSSQGKNAEVVCHSLLQWTMFCQNSPSWLFHLGWPYIAWLIVSLSYTKLESCDYFGYFSVIVIFILPASDRWGQEICASFWWSWTIKKAECQGIDAFELWCWRRLLRVPWTARRSTSQS